MRNLDIKTRYFDRDTFQIPQIGNTWGCIVDFLDVTLVHGTGSQDVFSIRFREDVKYPELFWLADIDVPVGHGFKENLSVVEISNCVENIYNGVFRVQEVTVDSITIAFRKSTQINQPPDVVNPSGKPGSPEHGCDLVGYGTFKSYNPLEIYNICLQAKDGFIPANDNTVKSPSRARSFFGAYVSDYSGFLLTDIYGNNRSGFNKSTTVGNYMSNRYTNTPWQDGNLKAYDTALRVMKSEMLIKDHNNFIRGEHRGIFGLYGYPYQDSTTVTSEGYLVKHVENPANSTTFAKAPIMFSLRDWEYV